MGWPKAEAGRARKREWSKNWIKTPSGKLSRQRTSRKYRQSKKGKATELARIERDRDKFQCRWWKNNALRDGKIKRQPCEVCGSLESEAHHPDYNQPKRIRWLCKQHHREEHTK